MVALSLFWKKHLLCHNIEQSAFPSLFIPSRWSWSFFLIVLDNFSVHFCAKSPPFFFFFIWGLFVQYMIFAHRFAWRYLRWTKCYMYEMIRNQPPYLNQGNRSCLSVLLYSQSTSRGLVDARPEYRGFPNLFFCWHQPGVYVKVKYLSLVPWSSPSSPCPWTMVKKMVVGRFLPSPREFWTWFLLSQYSSGVHSSNWGGLELAVAVL
jgi:hypothetical protein